MPRKLSIAPMVTMVRLALSDRIVRQDGCLFGWHSCAVVALVGSAGSATLRDVPIGRGSTRYVTKVKRPDSGASEEVLTLSHKSSSPIFHDIPP
jgi:hypothetical protein